MRVTMREKCAYEGEVRLPWLLKATVVCRGRQPQQAFLCSIITAAEACLKTCESTMQLHSLQVRSLSNCSPNNAVYLPLIRVLIKQKPF